MYYNKIEMASDFFYKAIADFKVTSPKNPADKELSGYLGDALYGTGGVAEKRGQDKAAM